MTMSKKVLMLHHDHKRTYQVINKKERKKEKKSMIQQCSHVGG